MGVTVVSVLRAIGAVALVLLFAAGILAMAGLIVALVVYGLSLVPW
jgi:hypothetical protein